MSVKYIVLGNIMGFTGIGAIVFAGYDWRISAILGITSGIIGNYLYFDIKKKLTNMLKTIIDSIGGYVGLKFEDGKIIRVDADVELSKIDKFIGDVNEEED